MSKLIRGTQVPLIISSIKNFQPRQIHVRSFHNLYISQSRMHTILKYLTLTRIVICASLLSHGFSAQANETELAQDREWLDLLHYHRIGLFSVFESQADDPRFFFAKTGKSDPHAELVATLKALEASDYANDSPICRFPARLHWLQSKGYLQDKDIAQCLKFQDWYSKIDAKSLTLAFPAAYLNSPSSMYGHTFIRINRKQGNNPLLDYSINYAANADPEDNELVFSYKGLSGGYPGVFSVLPYYQKIKEYSFLEARDVWEYDLALTEEEVAQFVRHTWEIQNTHFDYYFFTENCSYHLLTLLDAASPRLHLSDAFSVSAIPADTVRVIERAGIVADTHFRPSTMSLMTHMLENTDDEIQAKAKTIVEEDVDLISTIEDINTLEQAKTLELAYQYSRYLSVRKKQEQKKQSQKAITILSARSKIPENQVFEDYPRPAYRDDEGHNSSRIEASFGYNNELPFTQIGIRAAYHDRLDNLPGYLKGAKLEMFHAQFRHSETADGKHKNTIERIGLIDIASYSPRNDFLSPISWEVSTGLKRPDSERDELLPFLSAGWGASYLWQNQLFYALGIFDLNLDNDIDKGHHVSLGPKIGWLNQHEDWTMNLELRQAFDVSGADFKLRAIEFGIARRLEKDWQIRFNTAYSSHAKPEQSDATFSETFSLSLLHYF